jgi:Protein of unknown function (Hypoth_ymh)
MAKLTASQKTVVSALVQLVRSGDLSETFSVCRDSSRMGMLVLRQGKPVHRFEETQPQTFEALSRAGMLIVEVLEARFGLLNCTITDEAYAAVDSDFDSPDVSFVQHLSLVPDLAHLDTKLRDRCLPILTGGAADRAVWDSAVRTAGVVLEDRLHDVGGITDPSVIGQELVNRVFGASGTLASKFSVAAERQGYRDLFAGVVGVFRNPSAHRFIDPTPEEGGATLVFVNLLLKKLEALR